MESDKEAIARLEGKVDQNRRDLRTWIVFATLMLPALAFAFGIDPAVILPFVIASAIGLVVMVARRAWSDRSETRQRAERNTQFPTQPNSEVFKKT